MAQEVAAWRERRAASLDQPVRFVLADLAISGIAQRPPSDARGPAPVRGSMSERSRSRWSTTSSMRFAGRRARPGGDREADTEEIPRDLRPAVTLVSAWISQLARDMHIDTTLLATRSDLVDLLVAAPDARLAAGLEGGDGR